MAGEFITLIGAEAVERAASSIRQSAEMMNHAANIFREAIEEQRRAQEEFMEGFRAALREHVEEMIP